MGTRLLTALRGERWPGGRRVVRGSGSTSTPPLAEAEGPGLLSELKARARPAPRVVRAQEKSRYAAPALDGVEAWFRWPTRAPEGDLDALLSGDDAPKVSEPCFVLLRRDVLH